MNPKSSREGTPSWWRGERAVLAAFPQPCLLMTWIYSTLVTESYSHPCDTQHVLLLAAAGCIQPQGPSSSRAGSCLLPQGIFGNNSYIPSPSLLPVQGRCVELLAAWCNDSQDSEGKNLETLQRAPKCKISTSETGFIHHTSPWQPARAGEHDRGRPRPSQRAACDTETRMPLQ